MNFIYCFCFEANASCFYVDYIAETAIPVPSAPSDLTATSILTTEIDLAWTSNSASTELGFEIWRKTAQPLERPSCSLVLMCPAFHQSSEKTEEEKFLLFEDRWSHQ